MALPSDATAHATTLSPPSNPSLPPSSPASASPSASASDTAEAAALPARPTATRPAAASSPQAPAPAAPTPTPTKPPTPAASRRPQRQPPQQQQPPLHPPSASVPNSIHQHQHRHRHHGRTRSLLPPAISTSSKPALPLAVPASRHSDGDAPIRFLSKKLHKLRRDGNLSPAMEFPERLKQLPEGTDEEEVLRPNGQNNGVFMNLNQSIFGLIAAAGSTVNFNNRFEDQSSDEYDEDDDDAAGADVDNDDHGAPPRHGAATPTPTTAATQILPPQDKRNKRWSKDLSHSTIFTRQHSTGSGSTAKSSDRRSRLSENKLLRSLPSLKTRLSGKNKSSSSSSSSPPPPSMPASVGGSASAKTALFLGKGKQAMAGSRILEEDEEADADGEGSDGPTARGTARLSKHMPTSRSDEAQHEHGAPQDSSPVIRVSRAERSNSVRSIAPVMSRMLEAKAELAAARPSFDLDRLSSDKSRKGVVVDDDSSDAADAGGPSALARKLMEIFEFDKPEEVIDEYPCWLLQSVLLQGYMYITARHICFYAYLPKKANEVAKSGYLAKSGKRNPKYNRFWFRLKGDVLAYYRDPSNLYFPHGQIDLRYGISATVTDKDKDGVHFQVVTHHRTYYFRADSAPSAKEWVKSLQRVIFRSHNDGDSVKISLPIENVIDIEDTQALVEFADTCKIRVIDNDETYAIDEYFFSFFDYGKEAVRILRILIEDSSQQQSTPHRLGLPTNSQAGDDSTSQDSASMFGGGGDQQTAVWGTVPAPTAVSENKPKQTTRLQDSVRATLVPVSPISASPRASLDIPRGSFDALRSSFTSRGSLDLNRALRGGEAVRRSFSDRGRRSVSADRRQESGSMRPPPPQSDKQDSTDSFVQSSMEDPSLASLASLPAVVASSSGEPSSASQILHGSEVFQSPTAVRRSASASRRRDQKVARPAAGTPSQARGAQTPGTPKPGMPSTSWGMLGAPHTMKPPAHAFTTGHMAADPGAGERSSVDSQSPSGSGQPASLQNLAKLGSYPLQRAGAYAGWLNRQSRRMSSMLATESMGYVEKVSGMWKGGHKHYDEPPPGLRTDDELDDDAGVADVAVSNERFRAHFALPGSEKLQATYFGYLMRVLPLYGKIYISDRSFCFRSLLPGTRTKLILPLRDIENVTKEKGFRFGFSGLVVVIRGHEELFFEFGQADMRDDCAITLLQSLEAARYLRESGLLNEDEKAGAETALAERDALQVAREEAGVRQDDHPATPAGATAAAVAAVAEAAGTAPLNNRRVLRQSAASMLTESPTILFDDPKASFLNFKPAKPLRITCLTIGSRGDVQPYIALGKGLLAEGHQVRIATHPEFEGWIRGHGLDYGRVEGDPGELMRICIENGTFTWQFLREANAKMRNWLDELLASAWTACQDSDLLIESPSAMAGIHIAERLQVPYFRAFTMPWTRTRAYPHAFIMPEHKMGGAYNYITYVMFDNIFWKATASQINRWRNKTLGLPNTTLEKMQPNKVPFLYNFSASVVPPPLDYSDWIRVTGYWFLDEGTAEAKTATGGPHDKVLSEETGEDEDEDGKKAEAKSNAKIAKEVMDPTTPAWTPAWTPAKDLTDFIAKARRDNKKIVYVGFGSILVPDPAKMTQEVIDAVLKADVRCILSKGWSDRMVTAKEKEQAAAAAAAAAASSGEAMPASAPAPVPVVVDSSKAEVPLPPEIFQIKSAPHDWLFAQIDAAAHHGGSGTTGASLRAGIPTIIRPFFGDQFFFGGRVEDLGVGICLKKWGAQSFARALWEATNSERMIKKARVLGEQIRQENGVDMAIQCIYRDMEYAKSLVRAKASKNGSALRTSEGDGGLAGLGGGGGNGGDEDDDEPVESWTFVGDDVDPMQQSMILNPESLPRTLGSRTMGTAQA